MSFEVTSTPNRQRIQVLAEEVINQIAAGEVIERPSSIVKEVVENSLDAGSSEVHIFLRQGGLEEISVVDNGEGILLEDFPLTTIRHATSKLKVAPDLENIASFGFRGEALSSIASIAELTIKSRTKETSQAYEYRISFGEVTQPPAPTPGPLGTTLTIKHLFEKIPARLKFLKAAATEFSHCAKIVRDLALGNPEVAFYLYHQDRLIHHYKGETRPTRAIEVFKPPYTFLAIRNQTEGIALEGYLSPASVIQDRGEVFIYINQRCIKNKTITSAARNAYLTHLGPHHEPTGVLYLDIRTDWIDVNVHPQKTEVRLLKQENLYSFIFSSLKAALQDNQAPRDIPLAFSKPQFSEDKATPLKEPEVAYLSSPPATQEPFSFSSYSEPVSYSYEKKPLPENKISNPKVSRYRYLGQVKASYLLCEDLEGILFIDQHALHEKIVFEKLKNDFENQAIKTQALLFPKIISLGAEYQGRFEEFSPLFMKLGFELELFGNNEIAVKTRVENIEESKVERTILELLRFFIENNKPLALGEFVHPLLATVACHSVVRANHKLTDIEALSLIDQMGEIKEGWTCPHGRPVVLRISYPYLEKYFERL